MSGGAEEARGATRSGRPFRASNRGHYSSLADLKRAHSRLFVPGPRLFFAGRWSRRVGPRGRIYPVSSFVVAQRGGSSGGRPDWPN